MSDKKTLTYDFDTAGCKHIAITGTLSANDGDAIIQITPYFVKLSPLKRVRWFRRLWQWASGSRD